MRQPSADRALYYRQLRETLRATLAPELTSARARDAIGLIDRILAEFIVEEESAAALSATWGAAFEVALGRPDGTAVTAAGFDTVRAEAASAVADTAGSDDPEARALARRLVDVEHSFLEELDALRTDVLDLELSAAAGPSDECSVTADQLGAYLRRRYPASPALAVTGLSVVPGGRSKETVLVSLTGTDELPAEVILRKDRPVGLLQTRSADEFRLLQAVHGYGGVPVPEPFLADEDDETIGPGTFQIMERVAGQRAGEYFPDLAAPAEHGDAIARQLAAALARLHSMPLDRLAGTALDLRADPETPESIAKAVDALVGRIEQLSGPPCAAVYLARQWLLDHVDDVLPAPRVGLLQGDFGLHNTLVDGDRVTALVDWESASVGPPARELAAAWNAVTHLSTWPTFVAAYVDAGGSGEETDPVRIGFYRVFGALGAFMMSRLGGHLFRTGTKRDLLTAHSGLDSHFRGARNLARALADVT